MLFDAAAAERAHERALFWDSERSAVQEAIDGDGDGKVNEDEDEDAE